MATNAQAPAQSSFFKAHVLPALFIFLIPGFGAWFFSKAEQTTDDYIMSMIKADLARSKMTEVQKLEVTRFFRANPPSKIMASSDPALTQYQEMFAPTKTRYQVFRWSRWTAWTCLATTLATLVIVGVSVAYSFRSNAAQYWALRIGWPVLRTSATIQVLGQGALAVALSYWVTALWMNSYFPKLIGLIGVLAAGAAFALVAAIFAKPQQRFEITGDLLGESAAPSLWQRIREMAARLSTAPPDRIVAGVDPTFFVTEHPVIINGQEHHGRTLYVSLPMLKLLNVDEADAILGHELAHFSGEDTLWSRRISPLRGKFALYLQSLSGGLGVIIAHFMHAFWKLYELSMNQLSRAREFRADQIGAEVTSPGAMKRALIKVTSYCDFRSSTVQETLEQEKLDEGLNLSERLERGYPGYLATVSTNLTAIEEQVPHPFDSHPTLNNRLTNLGFEPEAALKDPDLHAPIAGTWYDKISTASEVETKLWNEQHKMMEAFHQDNRLWRLQGNTEENAATLREFFPRLVFPKKSGGGEVVLEFDRIQLSEWSAPLLFEQIKTAELQTTWGRRNLLLKHATSDGRVESVIPLRQYASGTQDLLSAFGQYFSRHNTAEALSRQPAQQA